MGALASESNILPRIDIIHIPTSKNNETAIIEK